MSEDWDDFVARMWGDPVVQQVDHLEPGGGEKVRIEKHALPTLPSRYEEDYPANGMQEEGAIASYRSTTQGDLTHIIEFEEYWEVHLDGHNPNHEPVNHLINDAPAAAFALTIVVLAILHKYYND